MSAISEFKAAMTLAVVRGNAEFKYRPTDVDPGVKFFVLLLEKLGAETLFSCEGHPFGFYVMFRRGNMTQETLTKLVDVSFGRASIELWPEDRFRFSINALELAILAAGHEWTERFKNIVLERLATKLVRKFGSVLPASAECQESVTREDQEELNDQCCCRV